MRVAITCRHVEIDDPTKERIHRKVEKLTRYFDKILEVEVILSQEKLDKVAEVILFSEGPKIRACESHPEILGALELAFEKAARQLKRFKSRMIDMHRRPARRRMRAMQTVMSAAPLPETDEELSALGEDHIVTASGQVITTEPIELLDMTPEDAAVHLELSGDSFFVFLNHNNHQVNVIHRRPDGNLGLIEPQND